ncbi:hypothetical protein PoB_002628900 [Plakobranchus ocellatus]|uniref:Uncharacterized protein n=1 Tax=Plakobranchus ocellatus TaxID=259542 RepID=A0AAV3ZZI7_9GAST|nr:hypothetical protein PoB_002628900 [Plakobranchus ocellatus]
MDRGTKRLSVSQGASYLFDFSALRLANVSVSAALWGLRAGESFWAFFPLGGAERVLLPPSLGSAAVTFDMITVATTNTYSSGFLTPVLAVAMALALIAAHQEEDARSDIKSQVPRTYCAWRLRAVKGQDDGVGLNFVLISKHLDAPSVSDATQLLHHLLLQATP